jgi:hypothetical protein
LCADLQLRWGLKQSYSPCWELSNSIKNSSIQWVLNPAIILWKFKNPLGFQLPKWELTWECGGSFPHTFPHSHTFGNIKHDSRASLLARTFASPCLGHEPKAKVTTVKIYTKFIPNSQGVPHYWFTLLVELVEPKCGTCKIHVSPKKKTLKIYERNTKIDG